MLQEEKGTRLQNPMELMEPVDDKSVIITMLSNISHLNIPLSRRLLNIFKLVYLIYQNVINKINLLF